ncbi:1-phosphatidylinositol 4,5-bisphosphate phosphodiesterase classes I and II-like isoform X2 [Amphibalanus amphitrite]|uniref:1-phosphatidylinositol 4,5-bisphosphate phosphodiesterase classes I and II-like isoform X1 n=1 Tax=Amphibalanus amphitrite TaxID=1232801 RepID=UPI001C912327|nr:1-phosphatidylinositol 4,5-bisphosphate phosphodiesterase classes I and II-like isoform X1 [Amphibalanus amphitrite]XP_043247600.1 1-phosphatidylinositol 4,5-bisphosphate phosphodiesterase classes I and II-like isoform X2 [Amphibalanus amphitrite]
MAGYRPAVHVVQLRPAVVPEELQRGDKFIRWDEDSATGVPVTLKVDPNGFYLYIVDQNKEVELLDIMTIRDTRTGRFAKTPKDQKVREVVTMGSTGNLEDKTVTVCYGPDVVNLTFVNFCCLKPETAKLWCDELLKMAYNLLSLHASVASLLQKAHTRIWLDVDKYGRIPVKNIVKSFASNKEDRKRVEKALESSGLPCVKSDTIEQDKFTMKHFLAFYMHLTGRREIEKIFDELCGGGGRKKGQMTVPQVVEFLNHEQRDPRLNEILYPYADAQKAREIIAQYEPNRANVQKGLLSVEGFMAYLMSDDNAVVAPEKFDLSDDMDQPLSHYFINSSHNTYLTGHQFTGKSSVEIYRQCLLTGCRCVELDFWNGRTEEPIVCHGYTMVTEIPAKDVIEAIAESAFKTSEWPVILSFENHCNPKQQAKIAQYCRDSFGDLLLDCPLENYPLEAGSPLPPPTALRRKILIKNKKKHHKQKLVTKQTSDTTFHLPLESGSPQEQVQGNGDVSRPAPPPLEKQPSQADDEDSDDAGSSSSDSDEDSLSPEERRLRENTQKDSGTAGKESEAGAEISALVNYVQPGHFHSFAEAERRNRSYEMSSMVETQATTLLKAFPVDFVNYNKRQLSRVYPKGTRLESSNFMPQVYWNAGCQLVALNFQTLDLAMQLNMGIFEYNNRSGYLLKPDIMRRPDRRFDPFAESTVDGIIAGTVSVKVISGQFLSEKRVNVWVEVDMYGLPADTVRRRFKTRVIQNNAINPVWDDETFVFKKVVLPELAVLRVAAYEESGRLLGHRVLPVVGLRPGYRHISLRNESGQPQGLSTLFVKVTVGDYVPDGLSDFAEALANPIKYREKRAQQLRVLTDEPDGEGLLDDDPENASLPTPARPPPTEEPGVGDGDGGVRDGPDVQSPGQPPPARGPAAAPGQTNSDPSASSAGLLGVFPLVFWQRFLQSRGYQPSRPDHRQPASERMEPLRPQHSQPNSVEEPAIPDCLLNAVPLDKLWEDKLVRERRLELDKKLESMRKKFARERLRPQDAPGPATTEKKNSFSRTHSKLVKKFSNSNKVEGLSLVAPDPADQEAVKTFCRQVAAAERELTERYIDMIHDALDKVVRSAQAQQLKKLEVYYDQKVAESKKKIESELKDASKRLDRKSVSKDERSRLRREMSQVIVRDGVQHRERLNEQVQQAKQALSQQHNQVRQQALDRRQSWRQRLDAEQTARTDQLRTEWLDSRPETNAA